VGRLITHEVLATRNTVRTRRRSRRLMATPHRLPFAGTGLSQTATSDTGVLSGARPDSIPLSHSSIRDDTPLASAADELDALAAFSIIVHQITTLAGYYGLVWWDECHHPFPSRGAGAVATATSHH
jgi:hypothetical protein